MSRAGAGCRQHKSTTSTEQNRSQLSSRMVGIIEIHHFSLADSFENPVRFTNRVIANTPVFYRLNRWMETLEAKGILPHYELTEHPLQQLIGQPLVTGIFGIGRTHCKWVDLDKNTRCWGVVKQSQGQVVRSFHWC